MTAVTMTQATLDKANAIRERAESEYARIRANADLSQSAIVRLLAKTYVKAKADMDALFGETSANQTKIIDDAMATAFGINDLAGSDPASRAQWSINLRDAAERVDDLDNPTYAMQLLTEATQLGDEAMARAVAKKAWDWGWADVVNAYGATRPRAGAAIDALIAASTSAANNSAVDLWGFLVMKPSELQSYKDFQIDQIAAS